MRLFLVRHGETDWNVQKRILGPEDGRLTGTGKEQAAKVREYLTEEGIVFSQIYCSPADRAKETLSILFPDRVEDVTIDGNLVERYYSDLIGLTKEEVGKLIGKEIPGRLSKELYFEGASQSIFTGHFKDNESLGAVHQRVKSFATRLLSPDTRRSVLVIGHMLINQYLLEFLMHGTTGRELVSGFQENGEVRAIDLDPGMEVSGFRSIKVWPS